jgi:hypothetical protein
MDKVAVSAPLDVLDGTTKVTAPSPVPELVPEIVIQLGKLDTVQEQGPVVSTETVKLPPANGSCKEAGIAKKAHADDNEGVKRRMRLLSTSAMYTFPVESTVTPRESPTGLRSPLRCLR